MQQRLADGLGVGGGQVDRDVGDRIAPGRWLVVQPGRHTARASLDLREQPSGAVRVDEPGVPPVGDVRSGPGHPIMPGRLGHTPPLLGHRAGGVGPWLGAGHPVISVDTRS